MADFDGRSSLLYRFNQKSMSTVKDVISLRFKSHQAEGVLLHGEGQRGDYITLELHRGRLDLYLNLGELRLSNISPENHLFSFLFASLWWLWESLPEIELEIGSDWEDMRALFSRTPPWLSWRFISTFYSEDRWAKIFVQIVQSFDESAEKSLVF